MVGDCDGSGVVGNFVGAGVIGERVGNGVGLWLCAFVGTTLGKDVLGWSVRLGVGEVLGLEVGLGLGDTVGEKVSPATVGDWALGDVVGPGVGRLLDPAVGADDSDGLGDRVGDDVGLWLSGSLVGLLESELEGPEGAQTQLPDVLGVFASKSMSLEPAPPLPSPPLPPEPPLLVSGGSKPALLPHRKTSV